MRSLSKRASVPLKSSTTEHGSRTSVRPAIWSLFLPHYLFITGDEIPEAYEKLNAYYTKHEKHMKKGEALAYVLSTEDTGCNHHAVDDFLPMVTAVGQG